MCIRSECWQYTRNIISGWWFGTFFIFPSVGNFIIPTDEVIFFRGVGIPPTSIPRSLSWIYGRSCELFPIGQFTMAGKANENMFICWIVFPISNSKKMETWFITISVGFHFSSFVFFPESVWAKGSSNSGGLLYIFICSHLHHIFITSSSHLHHIFTSFHLHIIILYPSPSLSLYLSLSLSLSLYLSLSLLIFSSSHRHIFSSSSHLHHILSSSHLHIVSFSHLQSLSFSLSLSLLIFSSSHLLIFITSSSHLHHHIFTSFHLHIIILYPSPSLSLSLSLYLSLSLFLSPLPSVMVSLLLFSSLFRPRAVPTRCHKWPPFRTKWGSIVKNWGFFCEFGWSS